MLCTLPQRALANSVSSQSPQELCHDERKAWDEARPKGCGYNGDEIGKIIDNYEALCGDEILSKGCGLMNEILTNWQQGLNACLTLAHCLNLPSGMAGILCAERMASCD
jgi:hypothetical protein